MAAGAIAGLVSTSGVVGTAGAADARPVSSPATPGTSPSAQAEPRWTAAAAQRFWTDRRMAEAKPLPDDRRPAPAEAPSPDAGRPLSQRAGVGPGSSHFGGLPMIGRMYVQRGSGSYFCTASVINSPHHNIVLTAGHCLDSRAGTGSLAFVPQWTAARPRPHGIFPVDTDSRGRSQVWIDQRYYDRGHTKGAPWDVAFVRLGARSDGKRVQDVVGGNALVTGRGYAFPRVRLIGYPSTDRQPLTCTNSTTRFTPTDGTPGSYLRIACDDYRSGTSGGPFLANFNTHTGRGDVVGSIGGWKTGGPTADVSYSPYFASDIRRLYDAAVAGAPPARPGVLSQ
ncbi:serine protease [Streptomyces sp. Ag109_G2-15]|uniref:trypsin-like serine peptidase n=1 Tax=Streptomyces sp. Ag109_G2-15 TaxID=1938850 RepID=UPI000BD981E0|nr:trypsin-like peptidase domain-containing protein [Streptomyces sp. Ag109_G2-15]SOD84651.1 V8-like Glu-specific endopeptidase [Streptomyces sp. Ag109_G2-15]